MLSLYKVNGYKIFDKIITVIDEPNKMALSMRFTRYVLTIHKVVSELFMGPRLTYNSLIDSNSRITILSIVQDML